MQQSNNITTLAAANVRTLTVEIRQVYGISKAYPACANARIIADLAGTKTLSRQALGLAQALGFRVVVTARADLSTIA